MATNNGCTEYVFMAAKIPFWDGKPRCDICPLLETYARKQCRMTGEYLVDTRVCGYQCPLIKISKEEFYGEQSEYVHI